MSEQVERYCNIINIYNKFTCLGCEINTRGVSKADITIQIPYVIEYHHETCKIKQGIPWVPTKNIKEKIHSIEIRFLRKIKHHARLNRIRSEDAFRFKHLFRKWKI